MNDLKTRMPRPQPRAETFSEHAHNIDARAAPGGAVLLQIDKGIGKQFMLMFWLSAVVTALAVLGLFVAWGAYRETRAHVNVLQYDLALVKAQLIEKGLYEPTSH